MPKLEASLPVSGPATAEIPGTIEVIFPSRATVRISGHVDAALLRAVLAELGGR